MRRPCRAESVESIRTLGVVAVVRLDAVAQLGPVVDALAAGDVRAIEVTMTMPAALEGLTTLAATRDERSLVGAGSVLDAETARLAILAGARFIVAPVFRADVVEMCHRYDVVAMPGAYTPTEILTAWEAGADLIKVFPASALGPGYLKDLKGPMPQLRLVPTGGVTVENAGAFVAAGASALGVGGALVAREAIARGDFARLTEYARRLTAAVRAARERA
ncbi:MAG TPA: bifunctional 4-hydroxy-2-oxoglutarate aldolase/2-dehydro-3-deoxy-phosphogluconate aldolase [Polyangia bacterium]|nr:bifunctional 4-hydroxy-2-oxoglutarate aldolase/2-dehydro-3-deoxy-phosphogluconate aldolase [Polyangia bacterium]